MTWKSTIYSGPNPDEEGYAEWLDEVMQEPWVLALEDLVRWSGVWVGTDEQLIQELKMRVDKGVRESEDFPSSLKQLLRYMDCAIDGILSSGLGVFDYHQELADGDLDDFDVPGWGPEAPILVKQGDAAYRPDYWKTQFELLKYWHPVPSAIFEFTASKDFGQGRTWTGTTKDLAKALAKHHPTDRKVPRVALDRARPEGVHYPFPEFQTIEEIDAMIDPYGREEHLTFHRQVKKWAPILKEQARIKITWEKRTAPPGLPESDGRQPRTYWTIEALRWKKSDF